MDKRLPFAELVQPILAEGRHLELLPRDIALLATIRDEIERNPDGLLTIPYSAIQDLSSRIDLLDVRDPQKAERRVSESMTRLLNGGCLLKAEIARLRLAGDAEYQITSLGEAIADWHVAQSRFSGEPLTAIFKVFISQLARIVEDAEHAATADACPPRYILVGRNSTGTTSTARYRRVVCCARSRWLCGYQEGPRACFRQRGPDRAAEGANARNRWTATQAWRAFQERERIR